MSVSCPNCNAEMAYRVGRKGRPDAWLSLVFVFPFRCKLCSCRFRALKWGIHYHRRRINRRVHQRLKTDFPATFSWGQTQYEGTVTDITFSGCRLQTDVRLAQDNELKILLQAPDFANGITVESARVRGVGTTSAGLSFLNLARVEKRRLFRFLFRLTDHHTPGPVLE